MALHEILAVVPSQLFLPDRKKGLASVKPFFEIRFRLVSHLIGCHDCRSFSAVSKVPVVCTSLPGRFFTLARRLTSRNWARTRPPETAHHDGLDGADLLVGDAHFPGHAEVMLHSGVTTHGQ